MLSWTTVVLRFLFSARSLSLALLLSCSLCLPDLDRVNLHVVDLSSKHSGDP